MIHELLGEETDEELNLLAGRLRPEHLAFAVRILEGEPRTPAYQAIYPKASLHAAQDQAFKLTLRGDIARFLKRAREILLHHNLISMAEVHRYVTEVITTNVTDVIDEDGSLNPRFGHLVEEVKAGEHGPEYKFVSKTAALKLAAQINGHHPGYGPSVGSGNPIEELAEAIQPTLGLPYGGDDAKGDSQSPDQ